MPPNKKKNKQKKKSNGGKAASAASSASGDANLNAEVLEALTRLADTLAQLDEVHDPDNGAGTSPEIKADGDAELVKETASLSINDDDCKAATTSTEVPENNDNASDGATEPVKENAEVSSKEDHDCEESASTSENNASPLTDDSPTTPPPTTKSTLIPPALPLSHWRTLPLSVTSAYQILHDGANYIHATSTKYTLVGKVDSKEGGNLALELRKGAELIGTATLLLFSESCGSSRSLRHYVKQSSRAVLSSLISLVKSFEDGVSQGKANDGNNVGAQKTGAVWSACDNLTQKLPKGNRAAMRRELMVWVRDCNESIEEFEEVLELGPLDDDGAEEGEDDMMMDEEQYTGKEMKMAKASVNVMKCSKNLLGLVLKACECVGEHADKLSQADQTEAQSAGAQEELDAGSQDQDEETTQQQKQHTEGRRKEMLQWISNLHEMARTVGEGVTNVGIMLYPPLDAARNQDEYQKWQEKKPKPPTSNSTNNEKTHPTIPTLGSTTLGLQLEHQLHALSECIESVHGAILPVSGESIRSCLSEEVVRAAERLDIAVGVRCKEVEEAVSVWDQEVA